MLCVRNALREDRSSRFLKEFTFRVPKVTAGNSKFPDIDFSSALAVGWSVVIENAQSS